MHFCVNFRANISHILYLWCSEHQSEQGGQQHCYHTSSQEKWVCLENNKYPSQELRYRYIHRISIPRKMLIAAWGSNISKKVFYWKIGRSRYSQQMVVILMFARHLISFSVAVRSQHALCRHPHCSSWMWPSNTWWCGICQWARTNFWLDDMNQMFISSINFGVLKKIFLETMLVWWPSCCCLSYL